MWKVAKEKKYGGVPNDLAIIKDNDIVTRAVRRMWCGRAMCICRVPFWTNQKWGMRDAPPMMKANTREIRLKNFHSSPIDISIFWPGFRIFVSDEIVDPEFSIFNYLEQYSIRSKSKSTTARASSMWFQCTVLIYLLQYMTKQSQYVCVVPKNRKSLLNKYNIS